MRTRIITGMLLGLLLLPGVSEAQNKGKGKGKNKANPNATIATEQDYAALGKYKEIVGKVTYIEPSTKLLNIHVEYQKMEPKNKGKGGVNGNGLTQQQQHQVQQLMSQMQRALQQHHSTHPGRGGRTNPQQQLMQQQQHMMRAQQIQYQYQMKLQQIMGTAMANNFQMVTHSIDFELQPVENVRVALTKLPLEYDDKGKVVEHSKEELKKRADPKISGAYQGKWEDLQEGETVKLYLMVPKVTKKKDEKDTAKKDDKSSTTTSKTPATAKPSNDLFLPKEAQGTNVGGLGGFGGTTADEDHPHPQITAILINVQDDQNPLAQAPGNGGGKRKKNQ